MSATEKRLLLSPPRLTKADAESINAALQSGWLAPAGPEIEAFERDVAFYLGARCAVALNSGTAALHLGLRRLGVRDGDRVLVPTATFAATVFPVKYLGAVPAFVDIDESWTMDPTSTAEAITSLRRGGKRIAAAIPVDLYGNSANYAELLPLLREHEIPVLEDAAEGLGATSSEGKVGSLGDASVLSFNGNKIITTSGGGMLVTDDEDFAAQVRHWSNQARDDFPWYEHSDIGFNYRLSNVLAALGRSQLRRIDDEVAKRRKIREWYRSRLEGMSGVLIQSDPNWGLSNAWLTIARFSSSLHPDASTRVREMLEKNGIESRPVWKPMHQQPIFLKSESFLTGAADSLFAEGLCLPSGTSMEEPDVDRVSALIAAQLRA